MNAQGDTCKIMCERNNISRKNSAFVACFSCDTLEKEHTKKIRFRSFENSLTPDGLERKRTRKILVGNAGKVQFCGANYGTPLAQRAEQSRYYIGVRNKRTGVMTVHSVEMVHCIPLLNTTEILEDEDAVNQTKTYTEKVDMLTSAFGSKRKRQAMESRLTYAKGNSDGGTAVVNSVDVDTLKKTGASSAHVTEGIPPQNADATAPEEVYSLQDIISAEEYFALEPLAKGLTEVTPAEIKQWENESKYGQLVLQTLKDSKLGLNINKAKLLVYYNFLIQLTKLVAQDVKKKDPLPYVPEPFKSKMLERFTLCGVTESGRKIRTMPSSMKDKAMAYAMVLALFIEDFRIELQVLNTDFKKGQQTLIKIAHALGCAAITQKKNNVSVKVIELKLPLFVPTGKTFRKKG